MTTPFRQPAAMLLTAAALLTGAGCASEAPNAGVVQAATPDEAKLLAFVISTPPKRLNMTPSSINQVKLEASPHGQDKNSNYVMDYDVLIEEAGIAGSRVVRFTTYAGNSASEGFAVFRDGKVEAVLVTVWA